MTYLAQELITRSWYLSGIIARNLQTPTGDQITDGLMLLNNLLDFKAIETDLIPYWTYIQVNLIPGQEYYFLPNIVAVESSTFNLGVVRYNMESITRRNYYGSSRIDNVQTLPFSYNYNRSVGGGTIALYFLPDSSYPLKLMAKIGFTNVGLQTDLNNALSTLTTGQVTNIAITNPGSGYTETPTVTITGGNGSGAIARAQVLNGNIVDINIINTGTGYTQTPNVVITGVGVGATAVASTSSFTFLQSENAGYDNAYIEYLRYALAQYMCSEYGILFNPESERILMKMARKLMFESPPDLSRLSYTLLSDKPGFNWGDVNIGQGYRP